VTGPVRIHQDPPCGGDRDFQFDLAWRIAGEKLNAREAAQAKVLSAHRGSVVITISAPAEAAGRHNSAV